MRPVTSLQCSKILQVISSSSQICSCILSPCAYDHKRQVCCILRQHSPLQDPIWLHLEREEEGCSVGTTVAALPHAAPLGPVLRAQHHVTSFHHHAHAMGIQI